MSDFRQILRSLSDQKVADAYREAIDRVVDARQELNDRGYKISAKNYPTFVTIRSEDLTIFREERIEL